MQDNITVIKVRDGNMDQKLPRSKADLSNLGVFTLEVDVFG